MEELNFTPKELKQLIDDSKLIGRGFFGRVFTYKDRLIKLDDSLYDLLKINDTSLSNEMYDYRYRFGEVNFADIEQIETLFKKQKDITLTKMPLGILKVNNTVPGIIIPFHKNHKNLALLPRDDYKKVLIVLRNLLKAVEELADNEISQSDLHICYKKSHNYNVLYNGETPQIIDLDGNFVTCGKYFKDAKKMFSDLGEIVFDFFNHPSIDSNTERRETPTSKDVKDLIDEMERKNRGRS